VRAPPQTVEAILSDKVNGPPDPVSHHASIGGGLPLADMNIDNARSMWDPKTVYLNTATYGLPPRTAWDALQEALDEWRGGRTSYYEWDKSVASARESWARIVGVPPEWVCVGSAVAGLAALIAASLPSGSRVLAPDIEFTSSLWPWMAHADRGIVVKTVPCCEIVASIDDSIDIVAFSPVQSATGEVIDSREVTTAARNHGAQVFVDATQACGWLPLDASIADYFVSGAYKWLMSPRGTAFMSIRPEHLDRIRPIAANWYAGEDVHDSYYGPPLRLAGSARRLDVSPAWFSWVGTKPTLELVESIGVEQIHEHDLRLANRFRNGLGLPDGDSAIVSVDMPDATDRLLRAGVMAVQIGDNLRASFHVYNTDTDVDAALEVLTK
jgi:selenocysteine lyase/cysteine desulfurase